MDSAELREQISIKDELGIQCGTLMDEHEHANAFEQYFCEVRRAAMRRLTSCSHFEEMMTALKMKLRIDTISFSVKQLQCMTNVAKNAL